MGKKPFLRSPAEKTGMATLILAGLIFYFDPWLSAMLGLLYIALCVTAAFWPQMQFYLPVVYRGRSGQEGVALTFDDGPSTALTRRILDLLDRYSVKATFFVSGVKALQYPDIISEIIDRGHTIGNHSFHHNPFLMLGRFRYLYGEISRLQEVLKTMGIVAYAFRPPVGIVNPKLPLVLEKLGMFCVTFSCSAGDAGNRFVKKLSTKILKKVKTGDIILLHDVEKASESENGFLLSEFERILQGTAGKGLKIVPLSELIGRQVMTKKGENPPLSPVRITKIF